MKRPRLSETDVVEISKQLPGLEHWSWETESRVKLEERDGRYVWIAQAGLHIDGIVHLMVDDATGRPLRAWVPSRGFRGGSFWLDSGQPESWREYESILGKLSSDRRPRMGIGAVLAAAREAAIANQLPWEEPVCLSFYHGDVWHVITRAFGKADNVEIEVRDLGLSIGKVARAGEIT